MNVLNKVTFESLKKNKVRTIVTIIGIILSTAMFTAVATIISSLYGYIRDIEIDSDGPYHIHSLHATEEMIAEATGDARTEFTALLGDLGYAEFDSSNTGKPYIAVFAMDKAFSDNMPIHMTEGRLPENGSEILLPEHLLSNGGAKYKLGEQMTLDIGRRVADGAEEFDGWQDETELYQETPFFGYEKIADKTARTFTVVGFYERPNLEPYSAPGYTALTRMENGESFAACELFIRVKDPARNFKAYAEEHTALNENGAIWHEELLMFEGYSRYNNITRAITNFAAVLCVLIFAGSVSLIYSAFSISVSERTKQFGLLASVGATRSQIGRSVLTEALSLSAIGIPIGVGAGIGGIGLTLYFLRDMFISFVNSSKLPMKLTVTWQAVLIAAAIALVTVLVSSWIPSIRAMRISPMEAIRQSKDVKAKGKSANASRLFIRLFGAEGVLAKKYYKRSSKKYRATIISLAMSVILFISASAFCLYITNEVSAVDNRPNYDGAYHGYLTVDAFTRLRGALSECADELAGCVEKDSDYGLYALITRENGTGEYWNYLDAHTAGGSMVFMDPNARVIYMDDASIRELLQKHGISEDGWFGEGSEKALVLNSESTPVYGDGTRENYVYDYLKDGTETLLVTKPIDDGKRFSLYWTGDRYGEGELVACRMDLSENAEYDDKGRPLNVETEDPEFNEIVIGALLRESPVGNEQSSVMEIIYPASRLMNGEEYMQFYFKSKDVQDSIARMKQVLADNNITVNQYDFYDATENNRTMANVVTIVKVFSYGFIALISLISVANVFNTVTTNVALRRRDYAMLRSMGMTKQGMNRMTRFECLIYGSRSLMIGLPIALALTVLIHRIASGGAHMRFVLPWTAIIIAVASVFAVVFVSMLYATGKLKRDNPIDALKDENV